MKDKPVILVVDDQSQNIELLEAYHIPQGYQIVTAATGEEAMEKLSGNQIDLILMDVMMPGMDGLEVTRRVRQDAAHRLLPIILVTALREKKDRVKGIEAGCDDFISKPVDKMELLARVRSLLKVKAYNDLMGNYRKELESEVASRNGELRHVLENLQQDITERKRAEEKLQSQFELITTLLDTIPSPIFYKDTSGVYQGCNRAWAEFTGKSKENIIGRTVDDVEPAEIADKYKAMDQELFDHPGAQTYEWKAKAADGSEKEIIFNKATFKDSDGRVAGLVGVMIDITERKRAEEELKQTLEKLSKSLIGTINAMSLIVETRDPYTAGHQKKVSNLARAIAQEMGLPNDTVDTIRMAGTIHDIGKISVPAEILSKPGKLKDTEFSLIKDHSRAGYDILKDVGLPYPIAETVYQHHERYDGSGYPQGLKGEQILLEARIISVADTVEAITSHRPYRPGFGIDIALQEVEKSKGILYDEKIVDVCIKLFREKKFCFE